VATLVTGFVVPTLDELIERISGNLNSFLVGVDAFVPGSDEWNLARVLAGEEFTIYGYQSSILREVFIQTASQANLETLGAMWKVLRNQATASTLTINVTAAAALTIPIATLLTDITGIDFETDAALTFVGAGTSPVNVTSDGTGASTALDVCAVLTFSSGIPNVTSEAPVTAIVTAGVDIEGLEAYRARILNSIQNPAQGGAFADYEQWALEVSGVDRVWVDQPSLGNVRTVHDGAATALSVQNYIDDPSRRPVTAIYTAIKGAGYGLAVDVTVTLEDDFTLPDVQASIPDELTSLARNEGGAGLTIANSEIRTSIGNAAGVKSYILNDIIIDGISVGVNADATAPATEFHEYDAGNTVIA